ncbi:hypothetical protein Lal_00014148, partial [Lupinus albus]
FHIRNSVHYTVVESWPDIYVGQCKHFGAGCQRRIQTSLNANRDIWEFRKINETRTCVFTSIFQDHAKLNSSVIANCIIQLVFEDPHIQIKSLCFGYTVTYRKACTAKLIAMSQIYELPRRLNIVEYYAPNKIVRYGASRHEDVQKIVINVYFQLPLSLSNEKLKKFGNDFSTMFRHMLPHNRIYVHVCWVHSVLSYPNGIMHNQYTAFVTLLAISAKRSRVLPITALIKATCHRLNSWFLYHRNEATIMIRTCHIYCEELTKVINENNRKAKCQLVHSFSRESRVSEFEVAGRDVSRHSMVYTLRQIQYWYDYGEFQSLRLSC